MPEYFSTFITGFQDVVSDALKNQVKDATITLLLDGLVSYKTNTPFDNISKIPFFNNNYYKLRHFDQVKNKSIEFMIQSIIKNHKSPPYFPREIKKGISSFRIMASIENQTVSINKNFLLQAEKFFSYVFGLRVNRNLPDAEVWFILRSEGVGLAGIRLRNKNQHDKALLKGELRPELANILCSLSNPQVNDVFLDPFAGSGAIPLQRAKMFPCKEIIASDIDAESFEKLIKRFRKKESRIKFRNWDALHLVEISNETIDKIVTDPPWGLFSHQDVNLDAFYRKMLVEFTRILKKEGIIVILTAQKELLMKSLLDIHELKLLQRFDILVSGKKAAVFKIQKLSN